MKVSTGLLFLAAVIVFMVIIFRQNSKFKAMLEYIYGGSDKLKGELLERGSFNEDDFDRMYVDFSDWVRKEVDTQTGETSVKFTMNEIRKRNNETFQLDLINRYIEGLEGGYEEIKELIYGLVEERGIYRG